MREEQLKAYLKIACAGKRLRVSGAELERALNLSGSDLRKLVNRLRCKGVPIASDRSGYFYAATAGEVYATIRQLRQMVSGLDNRRIADAVNILNAGSSAITEWDESIIRQLVDIVKVLSADRIRIYLRGGMEIEQAVESGK